MLCKWIFSMYLLQLVTCLSNAHCFWSFIRNYLWHDSALVLVAPKICSQEGCKWDAMFESHAETCIDWTQFNFLLKDFFSNLFTKNHQLCCWPIIQNLILQICTVFQVLRFHFSEVNELLYEHWAKFVLRGKFSTTIYVLCYNMYQ